VPSDVFFRKQLQENIEEEENVMKVGTSYRQKDISGEFDAVVVGSGIGGLGAAALLARHAGKKVLVLERHYTAGGFTHTFTRPGYEWDVGVHYVGQASTPGAPVLAALDAVTDGSLKWADMGEVYDRVVIGADSYDFVKGRQAFAERMKEYFPSERGVIDRYLARVADVVRSSGLFFAEKAVPAAIARVLGVLMRKRLLREARQTTLQALSELTSNARLTSVLTGQYGDYGLPPSKSSFFIHSLIVDHYLDGGAYPVGGASRIAASILPVVEGAGGAVFTSAEVETILVENDRAAGVRLTDGNEIRVPIVVSDAGALNTFGRLLPEEVRSRWGFEELVRRQRPSSAHLSLYLGLRHTAAELGLSKTNLWIYPGEDHDGNLERFFADPEAPLPVAYISFPSAKDPDFGGRHPGRATIEVVTLAPYAWFREWEAKPWKKRGAAYDELKGKLTEKLLEPLYTHCPSVRGRIDYAELSTPLSTAKFTGHPQGAIYGLAATPSLYQERRLRPATAIPGLFLTGADVCALGVGGALFGGVLTASAILRRDLRRSILKLAAA
jgi:all-trans-retinol 13,14-reductase